MLVPVRSLNHLIILNTKSPLTSHLHYATNFRLVCLSRSSKIYDFPLDDVKSVLDWESMGHLLPYVGFTEVKVHYTDGANMYSLRKPEGIAANGDSVCILTIIVHRCLGNVLIFIEDVSQYL